MIKGSKTELVPAKLEERQKAYEWCFHSETTKSHSGPPDYPEAPIISYAEFCDKGYEDYYFTGDKLEAGRGFFIIAAGETVGFISYSCFHLKPSIAELDIWLASEAYCGKGYGTDAVLALTVFLNQTMGIKEMIMAPSRKNTRAIRAYEKAGFRQTAQAMSDFLLPEYVALYGDGDYGKEGTAILLKQFQE